MLRNVHAILILLFLCLPGAARAGDYSHNITVGGTERSFAVHVPPSLAGGKDLPVVLVFHGGGGDGPGIRAQTGMDGVADRNGFIAVYPQGTSSLLKEKMRTWNSGGCCGIAGRKNIDDVSFVSEMIDFLVREYKADPRRIYATGHSNGSQLSYRLACELSGKIAAIAPNAGQRVLDDCKPDRPVPLLHIHGTADPCAKFEGGKECGGCYSKAFGLELGSSDRWPCRAVRAVVREHALMNGCADKTDITFTKGAMTCEAFSGCPKEAPVKLCAIAGAGHVWPGKNEGALPMCARNPDGALCRRYREAVGPRFEEVDAGELMWAFFKDLRLPEKQP
jgi:polyhydroxybutyrate depolymerase